MDEQRLPTIDVGDDGPVVDEPLRELVRQLFQGRAPHLPRPLPSRLGEYELLEMLGRGGASVVYRARVHGTDEERAIKTLGAPSEYDRERLRREAKTLSTLDHPGVVRLHSIQDDGSESFLVLEYVEGRSLAATLRAGAPSRRDAIAWCRQLLDALGYVHRAGVVHRDVKPANIVLDAANRVRVLDFGLAKIAASSSAMTGESALGTPAYMAPEQRRSAARATLQSDVYSAALVMYEILTGVRMTRARDAGERPSFEEVDRHRVAKFSPSLVAVIARAMERDPKRRHADANELSNAFEEALKRDRRSRFVTSAVYLTVASIAAGSGWAFVDWVIAS